MPDKKARIEALIKRNITEIIQFKLKDPHLGFCTITDVKVSADHSYATVLVSFILDKDKIRGIQLLRNAKGFIRTELAKTLDTRRCPEIRFVLDDGYEKEQKITDALARANNKKDGE